MPKAELSTGLEARLYALQRAGLPVAGVVLLHAVTLVLVLCLPSIWWAKCIALGLLLLSMFRLLHMYRWVRELRSISLQGKHCLLILPNKECALTLRDAYYSRWCLVLHFKGIRWLPSALLLVPANFNNDADYRDLYQLLRSF